MAHDLTPTTFAQAIAAGQKSVSSMHMDLTYSGTLADSMKLSGTAASDVVRNGQKTDLHMTMSVAGTDLDLYLIGSDVYFGMGQATRGKYVRATADELAQRSNLSSLLHGTSTADLGAQAQAFATGITSFTKQGDRRRRRHRRDALRDDPRPVEAHQRLVGA